MQGNYEIFRMLKARDLDDNPFCIIGVVHPKHWAVTIHYESIMTKEYILALSDSKMAPDCTVRKFLELLYKANLPEIDPLGRQAVIIPYYAGRCIANSLNVYMTARDQQFKPCKSWPVIDNIPTYGFLTSVASRRYYTKGTKGAEHMFNGIFAWDDGFGEKIFSCLYSKEQWRDFVLNKSCLNASDAADAISDLENAVMPETSQYDPVVLTGGVGEILYRALNYEIAMTQIAEQFDEVPWSGSQTNIDVLMN